MIEIKYKVNTNKICCTKLGIKMYIYYSYI